MKTITAHGVTIDTDQFNGRHVHVEWHPAALARGVSGCQADGIWLGRVRLALGVLNTGNGAALLVPTDDIVSIEATP